MNQRADVILVEDNISDADLVMRAFTKNKLANLVLHLKDGQEALDYFFTDGTYKPFNVIGIPKVIFLDLKMPKVNGIEVLRQLKANEHTKIIPVVVLTSSKEDPDIEICYRLGANSYVVKPLNWDDFTKAITHLGYYWMLVNEPAK